MLREIAKNLRCLVTDNKLIFALISVSLIISVMTLLYVTVEVQYNSAGEISAESNFSFVGILPQDDDMDTLSKQLDDFCKNHDAVKYHYVSYNCGGEKLAFSLAAFFKDEDLQKYIDSQQYITKKVTADELISGNAVLMKDNAVDLSGELSLNSVPLNIAAAYSDSSLPFADGVIPLQTALQTGAEPVAYIVSLESDTSGEILRKYRDDLVDIFGSERVLTEADSAVLADSAEGFNGENITLIVMAAAAFVNIVFLFMYTIKKRIRNILVYKLCGATSSQISYIIYLEMLAVIAAHIIVAFLVFRLGLFNIIKRYDTAFAYGLSPEHYLFTAFAAILIETIFVYPTILKYAKTDAIKLKRM